MFLSHSMENKTLNRETYAIIKSNRFFHTLPSNNRHTHTEKKKDRTDITHTHTNNYQNQNLFINVFEAISLRATFIDLRHE